MAVCRNGFLSSPRSSPATAGAISALALIEGAQPEWYGKAVCAQTSPEEFFPEKGGSTRVAKQICGGCEVWRECLEWALHHQERWGIWGGLSERERRKVTKQRENVAKLKEVS